MTKLLALAALLLAAPARATFTLTVSTSGPNSPSRITSSPSGIDCPNTACSHAFSSGTVITLTEVPASTMTFAGWGTLPQCRTNLPTCTFTMPAAGTAVSAAFNPIVRLSLYGNGLGLVFSSGTLAGQLQCGTTGVCANGAALTHSFPKGTQIVLAEAPGSSSTFVGWTGPAGCGTASTCTFMLNGYTTVVATFTSAGPYTLAVKVNGGGTVTSSPAGISCPPTCAHAFTSGTSVSLTTSAAAGYTFSAWANGGCSGRSPCIVTATTTAQGLGGIYSPAATFTKAR